jgi:phosphate-selective porin
MGKKFGMVEGLLLLIAFLMWFQAALPGVALAETSDEILERLEELGNITRKQEKEIERLENELKQSISDIRKQQDKAAGEAIGAEKEETFVKAYRKTKSFGIAGRVQFRYTHVENDDNHGNVTSQKVYDSPEFDGFCLRRVRLRVQGGITDDWSYHVQFSYDGAENADAEIDPADPDYELKKNDIGFKLQDAEINYRLHRYFNIHLGQYKTRFTNSYLTRGPNLPLCERPLIIDKITPPTRDIGISIESEKGGYSFDGREHGMPIYDKPIYYAVGLYNGSGFNHMRNDNEQFMYMGMLLLRPCKHFNFGVSYAHNREGYKYDQVFGDPQIENINGTDYYVYEAEDGDPVEDVDYWDFNAAVDMGRVHVQAEYIRRDADPCPSGFDSYVDYGYGIQGQVDIFDNFQLTCRYDWLDLNDDVDSSKDSEWYTVGYNWFIYGQKVKWQLNYSFREEMHGDDVDNDVLITHFQVLF